MKVKDRDLRDAVLGLLVTIGSRAAHPVALDTVNQGLQQAQERANRAGMLMALRVLVASIPIDWSPINVAGIDEAMIHEQKASTTLLDMVVESVDEHSIEEAMGASLLGPISLN